MSEGAEKIKVNVTRLTDKIQIELSADSTVSDLAEKVAKKFASEAAKESFRSFSLMYHGYTILANDCTNTKISSVPTIGNVDNDNKIQKKNITNGSSIYVIFCNSKLKNEENQNNKYFYFDDYLSVKGKEKKRNEKQDNNSNGNESSWPPFRIGIGIADLLLFAAAVVTFLLKIHIVIVIIFIVLFIIDTALLCGWHYILPKILPEALLKMIGLKTNVLQKDQNKAQKDIPEREYAKKKIK